jgi:hypothetical protein
VRQFSHQGIQVGNQQDCKQHVHHGPEPLHSAVHPVKEESSQLSTTDSIGQASLVAKETSRTGKEQKIDLPLSVDNTAPDVVDLKII